MKQWKRRLGYVALILAFVVLVGPFLVPIPPLEGTQPVEALAGPDSEFVEIVGLAVHFEEEGEGEPVFILLHGFGASLFTWREVQQPISEWGRTLAYDRPAFGLTERPLPEAWQAGVNPYSPEAQVEILIGLMDALEIEQAILVGNSAGGTVAVNAALQHPERVQALILVDAAIYEGGGAPDWVKPLLRTPQMRRLGPWLTRSIASRGGALIEMAWHNPAQIEAEVLQGYRLPLQAENWDRALWELTLSSRDLDLDERLDELRLPVLVITGDDDRIVPTELSIQLAADIEGATLAVLEACGHVPQEECPAAFMEAVEAFLHPLLD